MDRRSFCAGAAGISLTFSIPEMNMTNRVDTKLAELGLTLPEAAAPVASYVPLVEVNGLIHLSGQLPFKDGKVVDTVVGALEALAHHLRESTVIPR